MRLTASCINLLEIIGVVSSHLSLIISYLSTKSSELPLKPPRAYIYWKSALATAANVHLLFYILLTVTQHCLYKSNL